MKKHLHSPRRAGRSQAKRKIHGAKANKNKQSKQPSSLNCKPTANIFRHGVKKIINKTYSKILHHKQLLSLYMITYGAILSNRLGIAAIGTAMARAFGTDPKHGIKQVDRFLSSPKIKIEQLFNHLIPIVIGQKKSILVSMDWTEFDNDDHSTLALSLITKGKRTPLLIWKTVKKSTIKGKKKRYEKEVLARLKKFIPENVEVIIVADREFGNVDLFSYLRKKLNFHFVIRYKKGIYVGNKEYLVPSYELVPKNGKIKVLHNEVLTLSEAGPYTMVLTKAKGMKEPWCLATSIQVTNGRLIVDCYSKRFQCEETFRDIKDKRYGYGLRLTQITKAFRRDRLIFIFAFVYLIQMVMGVSSEKIGLDKKSRANTVKRRTHSIFRQGRDLIGNVKNEIFIALSTVFKDLLNSLLSIGFESIFIQ